MENEETLNHLQILNNEISEAINKFEMNTELQVGDIKSITSPRITCTSEIRRLFFEIEFLNTRLYLKGGEMKVRPKTETP